MPEWHLLIWFLAGCSLLGWSWPPLFCAIPLLVLAVTVTIVQSITAPVVACAPLARQNRWVRFQLWLLTVWLHFLQPLARLSGRLGHGLTLWRKRCSPGSASLRRRQDVLLTKEWIAIETRVATILEQLRQDRAIALSGSEFDRWDLEVHGGMFGAARLLIAIEDWSGGQLVRTRISARWRLGARLAVAAFGILALAAALDRAWIASAVCAIVAVLFALSALRQASGAMAALIRATSDLRPEPT